MTLEELFEAHQQLYSQVEVLVNKGFLPMQQQLVKITEDVKQLNAEVGLLKDVQPLIETKKVRRKLNYQDCFNVRSLAAGGMKSPTISNQTGIPKSTVEKYMKMTEEEVYKLEMKDAAEGEGAVTFTHFGEPEEDMSGGL